MVLRNLYLARANRQFVENMKVRLGLKEHSLKVIECNDKFVLKEQYAPCNTHFDTEKDILWSVIMYFIQEYVITSTV